MVGAAFFACELAAGDALMKITQIRLEPDEARVPLEKYVFGGPYGGIRVPRGIDPAFVGRYLGERLDHEADAGDLAKALEVLQFYECAETLPAIRRLEGPAGRDFEGLTRQLVLLQILGEIGEPEDLSRARERLGRDLVPHPSAAEAAAYYFDTYLSLAPGIEIDAYESRLRELEKSLAARQEESEADMAAYDKIAALVNNGIPRARAHMAFKARVLALAPVPQREELVRIYLGLGGVNTGYFQIWAGRRLRRLASDGAGAEILIQLGDAIDAADAEAVGTERSVDVVVLRAARACTYLGGSLNDRQKAKVARAGTGTMDFLWDE